jgi:hypothetical protein
VAEYPINNFYIFGVPQKHQFIFPVHFQLKHEKSTFSWYKHQNIDFRPEYGDSMFL